MSHASSFPRGGHRLQLLQGSRELFPALVEAIDAAQREVRLETYIFDFTGQSMEVAYALERAARRAVDVMVVVDGFGSAPLPPAWRERFEQAGVEWRVYAPLGWLGILWLGSWRRLHRKLCVVDGQVAFCGGVNILDDFHDPNHGPLEAPRLDFSVRVTGPLVAQVHATMTQLWLRIQAMRDVRRARLVGALESLRASSVERRRKSEPGRRWCCATICATARASSVPTAAPSGARARKSSLPTPISSPDARCARRWFRRLTVA
jgi:cardiolipin synthase A/B